MATLTTDYIRAWCYGLIGVIADEAFEEQRELIIERYYGGDWEAFKAASTDGLAKHVPSQADIKALALLIRDTSPVPYDLGYEDKQYLAEARTQLIDAFCGLLDGDIDVCTDALERASRRLEFITYERKRQDKRDYHNPFAEMRPIFEKLTLRTATLARRFGKLSVSE